MIMRERVSPAAAGVPMAAPPVVGMHLEPRGGLEGSSRIQDAHHAVAVVAHSVARGVLESAPVEAVRGLAKASSSRGETPDAIGRGRYVTGCKICVGWHASSLVCIEHERWCLDTGLLCRCVNTDTRVQIQSPLFLHFAVGLWLLANESTAMRVKRAATLTAFVIRRLESLFSHYLRLKQHHHPSITASNTT